MSPTAPVPGPLRNRAGDAHCENTNVSAKADVVTNTELSALGTPLFPLPSSRDEIWASVAPVSGSGPETRGPAYREEDVNLSVHLWWRGVRHQLNQQALSDGEHR